MMRVEEVEVLEVDCVALESGLQAACIAVAIQIVLVQICEPTSTIVKGCEVCGQAWGLRPFGVIALMAIK